MISPLHEARPRRRRRGRGAGLIALCALAGLGPVRAEMPVRDVTSLGTDPAPGTLFFSDGRAGAGPGGPPGTGPGTGLLPFAQWARERPAEREALAPFPTYAEPVVPVVVNGLAKAPRQEHLTMYVASGRFAVARPPERVDLARLATLAFVERMDPRIKHRAIGPGDVVPNRDPAAAFNRRPDRRWCETPAGAPAGTPPPLCLDSRYALEGKLPLGVRLANKLEEGGKKIAETVDFQSEVRALTPAEAAPLAGLTGLPGPVAGAVEQRIVWVNQILRFGTLLAVAQPHPGDPGRTIVSAYLALAVKTDVLERKREFERVPVLRNLLPAQVLMGNSSFNTGDSISAGLPTYARNRLAALAEAVAKE